MSKPIVTKPTNRTYHIAERLGIAPDKFQEMVCQIVEYVGQGDEVSDFIRRDMRTLEDAHEDVLKELNDEAAATLKRRLINIQDYYKSPEWLEVNGFKINTNHMLGVHEGEKVIIPMSNGQFHEFTPEQWANRRMMTGAEVLTPPRPF